METEVVVRSATGSVRDTEMEVLREDAMVQRRMCESAVRETQRVRDVARRGVQAGATRVQELEAEVAALQEKNRRHKRSASTLVATLAQIRLDRLATDALCISDSIIQEAQISYLTLANEELTQRMHLTPPPP